MILFQEFYRMQRNRLLQLVWCVLTVFALAACGDKPEKAEAPSAPPAKMEAAAPQAPAGAALHGKVHETFDSGGYTYVRINDGIRDIWVAVSQTPVQVGEEVSFGDGQVMPNFHSKSLDRTFEEIVFSTGIVGKGAPPAGTAPSAASSGGSFTDALQAEGMPATEQNLDAVNAAMGSSKAVVPFAELKIETAAGAVSYTVAEVFEKGANLNGKPVVVRGQVMKVSPGIMGKNWLHIQDGTGDPAKNTHDLVVTSSEVPEKGEVVTIAGVMSADKDFGFGYKYAVIVEEATIKR
jgi:predicted small lipoprotein YifL